MPLGPQIRRYRPSDVEAVYEAVLESKAELSLWMPWCHPAYAKCDAESWVESRAAAWERNEEWSFLIVDTHDRVLGGAGLHRLDLRNGVGELGYWVRTSATRQGVATSATRLMARWAFAEQGLRRLEILAAVGNAFSQRVALKAGFVREAILRERVVLQDRPHDCALFSLLQTDRDGASVSIA
jgi:ribosomal-protein-serine acetyltransferase